METLSFERTGSFTRGGSPKKSLGIGLAREWPSIIEKTRDMLVLYKGFNLNSVNLMGYDNENQDFVIEFYHPVNIEGYDMTTTIEYNTDTKEITGSKIIKPPCPDPLAFDEGSIERYSVEPQHLEEGYEPEKLANKIHDIFYQLSNK